MMLIVLFTQIYFFRARVRNAHNLDNINNEQRQQTSEKPYFSNYFTHICTIWLISMSIDVCSTVFFIPYAIDR